MYRLLAFIIPDQLQQHESVKSSGTRQSVSSWYGFLAIALLGSSGPVLAQELIVDINLIGENINEVSGKEQLLRNCALLESLADRTPEQNARLQTCQSIDALNPANADELAQLQAIENVFVPEEYFVISDSIVYQSDYQTTNVYQRLETIRSPLEISVETLSALSANSYTATDPSQNPALVSPSSVGGAASGGIDGKFGVFANGQFSSGDVKGAELQQDNDFSTSNISVGTDYRFTDNVVGGAAIGFINSQSDFTNISGGNESEGINVTLFGTWYEADKGYVDLVADFGTTSNALKRQVSLPGDDTLALVSGTTDASVYSLTASAGRTFSLRGWETGIYGRMTFINGSIDGFEEEFVTSNLGTGSRFSIDSQQVKSSKITVGGEVSRAFSMTKGVVIPKIRIEFESESEKSKESIIAEVDGDAQGYVGTGRDSSYTNIGIGGSLVLKNGLQLFGFFESHLQHDFVTQNWLKFGGRLSF